MEYLAESKHIKISPRKVRLVVDGVKKLQLTQALNSLQMLNKRAAIPVKKTLESAVANAVNNYKADKNGLKIKAITVGEGITYKRYHFAARGRTRPYKKRTSHIRVILEDNLTRAQTAAAAAPVQPEAAVKTEEKKPSIMKRITRRQKKEEAK